MKTTKRTTLASTEFTSGSVPIHEALHAKIVDAANALEDFIDAKDVEIDNETERLTRDMGEFASHIQGALFTFIVNCSPRRNAGSAEEREGRLDRLLEHLETLFYQLWLQHKTQLAKVEKQSRLERERVELLEWQKTTVSTANIGVEANAGQATE